MSENPVTEGGSDTPAEYVSVERIDHPEEQEVGFPGLESYGMRAEGFWKLTGPGIYIAMRGGSPNPVEVLYIGSSRNLLARISEPAHKSLREAFRNKDCWMILHTCRDEAQARHAEAILIEAYRPTLNIMGKGPLNKFSDLIRADENGE